MTITNELFKVLFFNMFKECVQHQNTVKYIQLHFDDFTLVISI